MKKRITALVMVLIMTLSLVPISPTRVQAASDNISLGNAQWLEDNVCYWFPFVDVSFGEGQKIFCISVDNGGTFTIPKKSLLGDGSDIKISGLMVDNNDEKKYVDAAAIKDNTEVNATQLFSLTVTSKSSDINQIKKFIQGMRFYRNEVSNSAKQKVTVISNSVVLDDDMTAVALDGKIHYFRYVPWDFSQTIDENRNWYTAYERAKQSTFNGLKGYLATITSDIEQIYICKSVGLGSLGAWVGGARTKTTTLEGSSIGFDSESINELNPGERISGQMADTWYWMCGPEAGRSYYKLQQPEYYYLGNGSSDGCDESYNFWYSAEPNNTNKSEDAFNQEYCMEYGYDENGEWNDLWADDGINKNSKWKIDGYLIEYSPYTNTNVAPSEPYEETKKSSVDTKIIPEALQEIKATIRGNDFIVSKDEAADSDETKIKEWADTSGTDKKGNPIERTEIESDTTTLSGVTSKKEITFTNTTTASGEDAITTTVTAYVVDKVNKDEGNSGNNIEIGANDFDISRDQEAKINTTAGDTLFKQLAGVVATDSGQTVSANDITVKSIVPKEDGKYYDVTFAYDGVEVTVKATVLLPNIKANDFIVTTDEAESTTPADVKNYSDVYVYEGTKDFPVVVDVDDISVVSKKDNSEPSSIENGEEFEFSITDSVDSKKYTDTATAYVVDEKTAGTGDNEGITVGANNFTITQEQESKVKEALNKNQSLIQIDGGKATCETFKKLADVVATDITETEDAIPYDSDSIVLTDVKDTATPHVYDVTFAYKGVTVTVKAYAAVVDADDFIISVEDAKNTDNDKIKDLANVEATDENGNPVSLDKITSNPEDLKDVTDTGKKDITFTNPNGTDGPIETTVTATIVDKTNEDTIEDGSQVKIGANDFCISVEQAQNKDSLKELFKNLAGVAATKDAASGVHTNAVRSDISIDTSAIQPTNGDYKGVYPVTFTWEGVSVTVNATVKADGIPTPEDQKPGENITGNDFTVPAGGEQLTQDSFKEKADVDAADDNGATVPTVVDSTDLAKLNEAISKGEKGEYPVKVQTQNGTQTTVTVTVKDTTVEVEDTSDPDKANETIAANNYTIGIDDYTLVTGADKLTNNIKLANAIAYDTDTKADVPIVDVDTSKIQNAAGTYDVTFKTANGTSTTVKLTINSDWKTIGDVDEASDANKKSDTTSNPTAVKNTTSQGGQNPSTGVQNPPADTVGEDKIFEKTNPKDIVEKIDSSKTVDKVTVDGKDIPTGNYTVNGDTITIKQSAFSSFSAGTTHPVQIIFKDGSKHSFNVKVIDYDEKTVIKKVPILKMKKNMGKGTKFTLNLVGIDKTAKKIYKSSNKKIATINSKGTITAKKPGKCVITAYVIQKGSYYKVKVNINVKKQRIKLYNLKKKALSKKSGELPEFNVYKRVFKGKKTKLKFTSVEKDAKITYTTSNKKIATVTKKGVIQGKKKGFAVVTAKIQQNGKTYVTRIFVRVDDNTKNKNLSKYLK